MFEKLFGNPVIEKILFYLIANESMYALELQKTLKIPPYSIQRALSRLEDAGVLVRQAVGRTQMYRFNPRYPFYEDFRKFLENAYSSLPEEIREKYYETLRKH